VSIFSAVLDGEKIYTWVTNHIVSVKCGRGESYKVEESKRLNDGARGDLMILRCFNCWFIVQVGLSLSRLHKYLAKFHGLSAIFSPQCCFVLDLAGAPTCSGTGCTTTVHKAQVFTPSCATRTVFFGIKLWTPDEDLYDTIKHYHFGEEWDL